MPPGPLHLPRYGLPPSPRACTSPTGSPKLLGPSGPGPAVGEGQTSRAHRHGGPTAEASVPEPGHLRVYEGICDHTSRTGRLDTGVAVDANDLHFSYKPSTIAPQIRVRRREVTLTVLSQVRMPWRFDSRVHGPVRRLLGQGRSREMARSGQFAGADLSLLPGGLCVYRSSCRRVRFPLSSGSRNSHA